MKDAICFALIVVAFGGLAYGWRKWLVVIRSSKFPKWERVVGTVACVGVTAQAARFAASFAHTGQATAALLVRWLIQSSVLFIISSFSLLIGPSPPRRPLLLSSVLLFALSFLVLMVSE